jgi:nitrogen fixation NifU-like protein
MDDFYRENILDHYKYPRYQGHLENPDIKFRDVNPTCGDDITFELKIEDDRGTDVAFSGHGCAISMASASMLAEELLGKSLDEVTAMDKQFVLDLLGIPIGPVRLKCALLPLKVVKAGVWGLDAWQREEA